MKRRLTLTIALIGNPKLLILDEPTVGIDSKLSRQIWQELRQRRNLGCGILVTTYVMSEAELTDAVYPNRGSAADFLLWTGIIKQSAALDRLFFKNSAIDLCQRCLK